MVEAFYRYTNWNPKCDIDYFAWDTSEEYIMTNKVEWRKVLNKFLWAAAEIVVAGILVYLTDKPELIFLVPISQAFRNYIKHK